MYILCIFLNNSFKASLEEYFTPTVLWENSNTAVAQNAQTLILSDDISNYKYIEYYFWLYTNSSKELCNTSGKIPIGKYTTILSLASQANYFSREVNCPSIGNEIVIKSGYSGNNSDQKACILWKILGWKH